MLFRAAVANARCGNVAEVKQYSATQIQSCAPRLHTLDYPLLLSTAPLCTGTCMTSGDAQIGDMRHTA